MFAIEGLGVPERVVEGIMVMGCPAEPLPALGVAPVPVEAGPEVADAATGVPEWVVQPGPVEHGGDPLPVEGGVVADEYRPPDAEVILEPGREPRGDLRVGRQAPAGNGYRWIGRVRCRFEQPPVEGVAGVVVDGPELGQHAVHRADAARLAVDEYPWCALAHLQRIVPESRPAAITGHRVTRPSRQPADTCKRPRSDVGGTAARQHQRRISDQDGTLRTLAQERTGYARRPCVWDRRAEEDPGDHALPLVECWCG